MKRVMVACLAVALTLSIACLAMAGPATQESPKKTMTGTIEQLDAKQQLVTVKPTVSGQQIQTQADAKQKPPEGPLVFRVDANTKIVARGGKQQGSQVQIQSQEPTGFALLKLGQLVRVVYQEAPPGPGVQQIQQQTPVQQQQIQQQKPVAVQQQQIQQKPVAVQQQQIQQQKPVAVQQQQQQIQQQKPAPKALVAVSIEILGQTPVQQGQGK